MKKAMRTNGGRRCSKAGEASSGADLSCTLELPRDEDGDREHREVDGRVVEQELGGRHRGRHLVVLDHDQVQGREEVVREDRAVALRSELRGA